MTSTKLKGNVTGIFADLPAIGTPAPDFRLTGTDLSDVGISAFKGKKVILNIFPSLDTSLCATTVRTFNKMAGELDNTVVLCISRDLPFAHKRFCTTEGLDDVISLSELRTSSFGKDYGVRIIEGTMEGLLARAIIILNEVGEVVYTELVPEITTEPDYESALNAIR